MTSGLPNSRTSGPVISSKSRPVLLRTSTIKSSSSTSSLTSYFGTPSFDSPTRVSGNEDAKSLICRAFVPHVAVHVSEDTDQLAKEKGFENFYEMVRPYGEDLHGRLTVRDSQGYSNSYDDFGVRFVGLREMAASGEKWETGMSRGVNGHRADEDLKVYLGGNVEEVEDLVDLHLQRQEMNASSPDGHQDQQFFYLHYLRRLLSALPVAPHETFSHPVACVIAISSRNSAPIETLRNLYASGNRVPLPKYVNTDYLRYYVLVHDEDRDDITKSTTLFDQMKKHFGLHCHLLRLRSGGRTVITDDDAVMFPTSQWRSASEELSGFNVTDLDDELGTQPLFLPESDASGIRTMVREMTQLSVVPFMERCIATWNDQIASRRRGISGRFLSMSKRYFGGGSSSRNASPSSSNYDAVHAFYPPHTPEAQMRKLADFAFMLRDWKLAHSTYELLRSDYNNDKAWKYHAAANEMTAITLILITPALTHKVRLETLDPLIDLSIYSYLSRCSANYSALRCLLVSVELLRVRNCIDDATKWAIRARDTPAVGKLGHALITERIGECYAARKPIVGGDGGGVGFGSRRRKAAMWRTLAGTEWVALKKELMARACLDAALPVYAKCGFKSILDVTERLKMKVGYDYDGGREGGIGEDVGGGVDGISKDEENFEGVEMGRGREMNVTSLPDSPPLSGKENEYER